MAGGDINCFTILRINEMIRDHWKLCKTLRVKIKRQILQTFFSGISCNVIAGFHHDHIFVPIEKAEEALQCLLQDQEEQIKIS